MILTLPVLVFLLGIGLHLATLRAFPRLGLLDFPERYGHKRGRIPYPVGVLSWLIFLFVFVALQSQLADPWSRQHIGLVLAITILGIATFVDDRKRLPWSLRLGIQALCAAIIFLSGTRIFSLTNPLGAWTGVPLLALDTFVVRMPLFSDPSIIGGLFTVVWLLLTINALNWFDGIPGQVSLLSTIGFLTIGFLSISNRVDDPELALLAFILAGISAASAVFELPPPRMLSGDSGAMFFGLLLGVLTIYAGGKVATAFLVLGVPLIDLGLVVLRRLSKGVSPARGNAVDEHLHHRLLAAGWSPQAVIGLTAFLGTAFGSAALFLTTTGKFVAALLLLLVMLCLSLYTRKR